jgi:photosystem II stability/assembly factor-like uncharacterized protein
MGTTNSWIYQSVDDGATWTRLAELGKVDDLVVDNLLVDEADPKTLYAAVWQMDEIGGGIYISHDGGHTWASSPGMEGKSVRALAQAPSNPKTLVAGAISGVFRSEDGGLSWTQISPEASGFIRWSLLRSIRPIRGRSTQEPGTCRGRRRTAGRRGTTLSKG